MESGLTTHQLSEELDQQRGSRHPPAYVERPLVVKLSGEKYKYNAISIENLEA
jgi:hypothetical protein